MDSSLLDGLSEQERKVLLKTLSEMSMGDNSLLNELKYADYKEIPVSIEEFITNDLYLGKAWKTSEGKSKIFPYWEKVAKNLFPTNTDTKVNNAIFSGARGLGKSEWAITFMLYLMYRIMCLKDPHSHYNLKPTEKICFAFMNITKTLAEDIGISKFQETVKSSPWFLSHGKLTGRDNIMWEPPDPIHIIIGSQSSHVIGQPIFACLDGDTMVLTDSGYIKIADMVGNKYRVASVSDDGNITYSEECFAIPTKKSTIEYEIELEDGTIVKCTPEHKFMLKDGTYKEAQYLTEEDELFFAPIYGYIYKTTNLINGKIYIGQKQSPVFLGEKYLGSGLKIKRAIDKYGKENFNVELVYLCKDKQELNQMEIYYIDKYHSTDPNIGYNIAYGGQGGNLVMDTELWSKLHSVENNGRYGKEVSQETRNKISKANRGKVRSPETIDRMSKSLRGRKKPDGFAEKISNAQRGRVRGELEMKHVRDGNKITAEKNRGRKIYNNGEKEIRLHPYDPIPDGFILGRIKKDDIKCNLPKNYHWYTNGTESVFCAKCPDGFIPGRKLKNENKESIRKLS